MPNTDRIDFEKLRSLLPQLATALGGELVSQEIELGQVSAGRYESETGVKVRYQFTIDVFEKDEGAVGTVRTPADELAGAFTKGNDDA